MAKQDQQVLMAQKTLLEKDLARARITDFKDATTEQVSVGSIVSLRDNAGGVVRYTLLGVWDSDPDNQLISYKTPLGQALLGKKNGDHVKLKLSGSENDYIIAGISRYVDTHN